MVVAQLSLALTLLVGAGLLVQGARALHATDIGMEPEGVLAVDLQVPFERYPEDIAIWRLQRALLDEVRRLPGVRGAGLGEAIPVASGFEALGIPLLSGRTLTRPDLDDPVRASAVVSRAFAERFWPGEDPIGKGVGSTRTDPPFFRVVGVVGDVPRATDAGNPFAETTLAVYYPVVDNPGVAGNWYWWPGSMTLLVRTELEDPMSLLPAVRAALTELDPEVPLANARRMDDVVTEATADVVFVSLLLGIAAAVSVLLAAVGLYGVVAYVVSQRTREIGMRMAIGARPGEVERMVVAGTLELAVAGVALGAPLAFLAATVLERAMAGVVAPEPWIYVLASGSLVLIALMAGWLPARRAASVDPVEALRAD